MRQTSKAVLLLIASAQAGQVTPGWSTKTTVAAPTLANQGTWIGYTGRPVYRHLAVAEMTPNVALTTKAAATTNDGTTGYVWGTSSCVNCVRGQTAGNKRTVWCSAGWNYEYTALLIAKDYAIKAATAHTWNVKGDGDGATALVAGDQGSCCYSLDQIILVADGDKGDAGADLNTKILNKWTCPAKYTWDNSAAKKENAYASVVISTKNWWCSDGSYNLTDDDLYATKGATATSNSATWVPNGANTALLDKSFLTSADDTDDRRDELFLQACRQKRTICEAMRVDESATDANRKRTIKGDNTAGFSSKEKCTWVLRSKTKAPTFTIGQVTKDKGLPSTIDVVYQEWVDGWQISAGVDFTTGWSNSKDTNQGGVPIAAMATAKYAKAYKWNYAGVTYAGSSVEDISTNNSQRGGEAWVYQTDGLGCVPNVTPAQDKAGDGTTVRNGCFASKTKKRWIELDVSGATYLNAIQDNYAGKLSTFNTDAASYNKYLADLKTANEKDAFSAFFSPPKKPAMVKRPGAPTKPSAYTGLQHWPAKSQTLMAKDASGFPTTDGKQFVLGNNNLGGWGAWTISRLAGGYETGAATNLISHSFGMLGTTQGTTADTGRSYAKQWQKDNLTTHQTGAQIKAQFTGAADGGGLMCTTAATTSTHACLLSKAGTSGAANAAYAYLNVSVWTNIAKTALTATDYNALKVDAFIQFYASAWADGKAYYAPAAAADGTALSEPAGAQALAASAAAALAVAAALY